MVSQSGSDPRGHESSGRTTPEGRRGSLAEGNSNTGSSVLQRLLETSWPQRETRTGFRRRMATDDAEDVNQQGREPIIEPVEAVKETEGARGVAGFDMSGMRDAIRALMQEELRKMAGEGNQGVGSGVARALNRIPADAPRGGRGESEPPSLRNAPGTS
jgi:hypothetical protein